jgi:ribosomal protein S27E
MITGVATWRCKCGVSVKVVTETDRANSNPDRLIASCPNCKDEQAVYAHRIISVTVDKGTGVFPKTVTEVTSIAAEKQGRQPRTKPRGRV